MAPEPRGLIATTQKERLNALLEFHVPFGGRDAELKQLDAFVSHGTSGYLFVTARPGFGKTALLANWVKASPHRDREICYHFISRPYRMADEESLLLNLCQQLVAFHDLTGDLPPRMADLRALLPALLATPPPDSKRLIVVLDGLDDALEWKPGRGLLPAALPGGVYIIISANERPDLDWPSELGLTGSVDQLRLEALAAGQVVDLLGKAGGKAAALAGNAKFIEALCDISQGDPFYLRFLVKDVEDGRITETNIGEQPVGLAGYLDDWVKELRKDVSVKEVYDLLGLFTVAKGPLRFNEMARISPQLGKGLLLREELSGDLSRYLVGGREEGYALWSQRFAEHLEDNEFHEGELEVYREQLLVYCAAWQEHKSEYALSYYPMHLFEAGRNRELFALIGRPWMDAKFAKTLSHRAFAADVTLATRAALEKEKPADVVQAVRTLVVYASLSSLANAAPPQALAVLAALGEAERAKGYAALIQNPREKIRSLCGIGVALARRSQGEAEAQLNEAASRAIAIDAWSYGTREPGFSGALLLADVAEGLAQAGAVHRAADLAQRCLERVAAVPEGPRSAVLGDLAGTLARAGLVEHAAAAAEAISNPYDGATALSEVVRALVRQGQFDRADELCRAIEAIWAKVAQLVGLVNTLAEAGERVRTAQAADQVATAADAAEVSWLKGPLLAQAARALAVAGQVGRAGDLAGKAVAQAQSVSDELERCWALAGVARGLAQSGLPHLVNRALELATALPVSDSNPSCARAKGKSLAGVANALAHAGDSERGLRLARESELLSRTMHPMGTTPVEFLLPELEELAGSLRLNSPLANAVRAIAEAGQVEAARGAIELIGGRELQALAREAFVDVLLSSGQFDLALAEARLHADPTSRAQALARAAECLLRNGEDQRALQAAHEALAAAEATDHPWKSDWAILDIVEALARGGHVDRAEVVADAVSDPEVKAWAYVQLAEALAEAGEPQRASAVIDQAMAAAVEAEAKHEVVTLIRSRVLRVPREQSLRISVAKRPSAVGPGFRRALSLGELIGPLSLYDQFCITGVILPTIGQVLMHAGQEAKAAEIAERVVARATLAAASGQFEHRDFALAQAVEVLSRAGRLERASAVAEAIQDPGRAARSLAVAATALSRRSEAARARSLADRAIAKTQALLSAPSGSETMAKVAMALASVGLWGRLGNEGHDYDAWIRALLGQQRALASVVDGLVQSGDDDQAAEVMCQAEIIANDDPNHLAEVMGAMPLVGQREQVAEISARAESVAEAIGTLEPRARVLLKLGVELSRVGESHRAYEVLRGVAAVARMMDTSRERTLVLVDVSRALADGGHFDDALAIEGGIENPEFAATAILHICRALVRADLNERASELAGQIGDIAKMVKDPADQARMYISAANAFGIVGDLRAAISSSINAILSSANAGRSSVFETLQTSAAYMRHLEPHRERTLWLIHEALVEVDGWLGASVPAGRTPTDAVAE